MTTQTPLLTPESVGKYYRTRNGRKTKIVEYYPKEKYCYKDEYNQAFLESGIFSTLINPHPLDIVAEWTEEPKLVPLPSEVPDWFLRHKELHTERQEIWDRIVSTFGTQPREWWMRLEKGDKFMFDNGTIREVRRFNGIIDKSDRTIFLGNEESEVRFVIDYCTPYTEPTPSEKFIASLTDEQKQLLKSIDDKLEMLNKV